MDSRGGVVPKLYWGIPVAHAGGGAGRGLVGAQPPSDTRKCPPLTLMMMMSRAWKMTIMGP